MRLRTLRLHHIGVPLKNKVRHASHERIDSENVVACVELEGGIRGYGEGVPRPYVTGETVQGAMAALARFDAARAIGDPGDFEAAVRATAGFELPDTAVDPRGMAGNAARCALESALLDAYGRAFGRTIGDAIRVLVEFAPLLHPKPRKVRYSGAITADSRLKEAWSACKMWGYDFRQVKIKVGVEGQDDVARIRLMRRLLWWRTDIRLDANEAWTPETLVERVRELMPFGPTAIEQPVSHRDVESIAETGVRKLVPIMLDESLCGMPDALSAIERGTADLFNVRLSKCGGIFPSLRLVELARRHGLNAQLGCHPGETGLLSAAGRHFATNVAGLRYLEGSYDKHVLAENLITRDITFGRGGWAKPLTGPGLGVDVDEATLERMTVARQDVAYE